MDNILAESYAACMRADRDAKLSCHEQDAQDFAHSRQTARVNLADVDRLRLHQLLEHHPVVRVLSRRDTDTERAERLAHSSMAQNIIRRRRFLYKPRTQRFSELRHILDCLRDVPDLVGVNHEHTAGRACVLACECRAVRVARGESRREVRGVVDYGADDFSAPNVGGDVGADLHFEVVEALRDGLFGESRYFFVAVS